MGTVSMPTPTTEMADTFRQAFYNNPGDEGDDPIMFGLKAIFETYGSEAFGVPSAACQPAHHPSVTASDLRNVLALLMSIDRHEIEAAGYDMPDGSWEEFQESPWTRFLKCNDACREAIVRVINSRMREAAIRYISVPQPLTPGLLADAFDAFWNAGLTHAQQEGNGTTYSNIGAMATGFAAVAQHLREGSKS